MASNYNIGPKIGIDGEAEFRKSIRNINSEYKALVAESKAVSAQMDAQGDHQGKLEKNSESLHKQIEKQREKFKLLEDAVAKSTAKFGESSIETNRLKGALYDTQATISGLEKELGSVTAELEGFLSANDDVANAKKSFESYQQQIHSVDNEFTLLKAEAKSVGAALSESGDEIGQLAVQSEQLTRQLDNQRKKLELLSSATTEAKTAFGESADETFKLKTAIFDTQTTISKLEKELRDTDDQLERLASGIEDVGQEAREAEGDVLSFGDILKANLASGAALDAAREIMEFFVELGKATVEAAADVKASNAQFSQAFGALESNARGALQTISDETQIAVTRMQAGYTAIYAFSKSVGADSSTALRIAQRSMTAAADSAAYYDKTIEEATETLQSFLKGNFENDAALGIAATETTRNAKANELYAKSFKDLTEAQKVDTLLAMVEAGNQASGAMGSAVREAGEWTNVMGELEEASHQLMATLGGPILEGLIPIIQGITNGINSLLEKSDWQVLTDSVAGFDAALQDTKSSIDATISATDSTAAVAASYVKSLQDMAAAGLDTAQAQRKYASTVELLNKLYPQLNLTIDKQTGLLEQDTDAILANVDALKQQAVQQEFQARYSDLLERRAQIEVDLARAHARQLELQANANALVEQGASAEAAYTNSLALSSIGLADVNAQLDPMAQRLADVWAEQVDTTRAIEEGEAALAAYDAELASLQAAMAGYSESADQAAASTDALGQAAADVPPILADIEKAYSDAYTAAQDSIESQIGLFTEFSDESELSAEKIVENWKKQQVAFASYSDNLKKAVDMGLDQALVQQLSDGSQQSMQILDEFVNGTEMTVDEINAAFSDRMNASDHLAEQLRDMQLAASETYQQMRKDAYDSGYYIVDGVAYAVRNNTSILESAMRDMAKKATAAFNHTMDINSPSGVMMEAGDNTVDGLVLQIQRRAADFERAMSSMADSGATALQERLAHAEAYPSVYSLPDGLGAGSTTNNRTVTYGGISININTQPGQDPQSIADAVLAELTVRLGQEVSALG